MRGYLNMLLQAALVHSLPLKEAELNVRGLALWGRINTLNGKDYLIASATESLRAVHGKVVSSVIYLFSQDGIEWADLGEANSDDRCIAVNMQTLLSGDPHMKHHWPPKPGAEDEEGNDEPTDSKVKYEQVTELRRLRVMVDDITAQTNLVPNGCQVVNADGCIVSNPLFAGVAYPDKLESYYHQHQGPKGRSAADDVRGSWALVHDKFRNITVYRNLLYMGYSFFYNSMNNTWGGFYHGDGLKNNDLIFML
eukprot:jgi/Ulvmu1/12182/UM085_0046.1